MAEHPSPDAGAPMEEPDARAPGLPRMPGLEREEELACQDAGLDPKYCSRCGISHARSPKFFPNEWARFAAVFSDPRALAAVGRLMNGSPRELARAVLRTPACASGRQRQWPSRPRRQQLNGRFEIYYSTQKNTALAAKLQHVHSLGGDVFTKLEPIDVSINFETHVLPKPILNWEAQRPKSSIKWPLLS